MNGIGYVSLVDTTRDELRERIGQARERFDRLIREADPQARPAGSDWTVQQYAAHVLSVALHYREIIHGREYLRAATTGEVHLNNQAEMEALIAPVPELADQLQAVEAEMDGYFDAHTDDRPVIPFHGGVMVSGITGQTNWLGELVMHGQDIARAMKAPYKIDERDMLLVARGMMEYGHGFLRADTSPDTDICVALKVPDARPFVIRIQGGVAAFRARTPADRPDAVLRVPASTLTEMLYERIGPFTAVRRGLFVVGGRRPWVALKLQSYFGS